MKTILLFWITLQIAFAGCPGTVADHVVFSGIQPKVNVAKEIGYPEDWSYRQLGGGETLPGVGPLRGGTAHTYLATRPDGSRVVLKCYEKLSTLSRDKRATAFLKRKFKELGIEIGIAKYTPSKTNRLVLETEYLEGQDLKSFLNANRKKKELIRDLTRFYNEQVLKFQAHVENKPGLLRSIPDEWPETYKMPPDLAEGREVLLKPENFIVTLDPDRPGSLRLVLIDPE